MLTAFLWIHILSGLVAFTSSPFALIAKKGGLLHRRSGKVFSFAMYGVCATAFVLSVAKSNLFLFVIGVFSFYLVSSAQRILLMKNFKRGDSVASYDWALAIAMLIFGLLFITYGIYAILHQNPMGIVMLVFGSIGASNAFIDIRTYLNGPKDRKFWILIHIGRMLGAMTAAYTAFLVVNGSFFPGIPGWWLWLLPNLIFTPLTIYFSRREKKK